MSRVGRSCSCLCLTAVGHVLDYLPYDTNHPEESLKSRIVVWTLVGIVLIVGVIIIATSPKSARTPKVTTELVKSEAARAKGQIDRLVVRLAEAKKVVVPGAAPDKNAEEADRLLAEAGEKLDQAMQATDLKQAEQLLVDGRQTLRRARRAVELATKSVARPRGM